MDSLPPGTQIYASDPSEWVFPVGTKVWKQFSRDGKRIETRLFQKTQPGYWVRTTYAWSDDESAATISPGGDMPLGTDGGTYHIPTPDECDQCHRGRTDHLLGFEQVSLGLAGATGLTLAELVAEQLDHAASRAHEPDRRRRRDRRRGGPAVVAPRQLRRVVPQRQLRLHGLWVRPAHEARSDACSTDGRRRISIARTTTLGLLATTPTWNGQTRIVPGDPSHSLLVKLISNRGTNNPVANQMPPIATFIVDTADTKGVVDWISQMPRASTADAGGDAQALDATPGSDAQPGAEASASAGADASDATLPDAENRQRGRVVETDWPLP